MRQLKYYIAAAICGGLGVLTLLVYLFVASVDAYFIVAMILGLATYLLIGIGDFAVNDPTKLHTLSNHFSWE